MSQFNESARHRLRVSGKALAQGDCTKSGFQPMLDLAHAVAPGSTQELGQEVALELITKPSKLGWFLSSPWRFARYLWIDRLRARRAHGHGKVVRLPVDGIAGPAPEPSDAFHRGELEALMPRVRQTYRSALVALAQTNPAAAVVYRLNRRERYTIRAIADRLGVTPSRCYQLRDVGRTFVKARFVQAGIEPDRWL